MNPRHQLRRDLRGPIEPLRARWPAELHDCVLIAAHPRARAVAAIDMMQRLWRVDVGPGSAAPALEAADYVAQVSGGRLRPLPPGRSSALEYLQTRRHVRVGPAPTDVAVTRLSQDMEDLAERGAWLDDRTLVVEWTNSADYHRGLVHTIVRSHVLDSASAPLGELRWTRRGRVDIPWDAGAGVVAVLADDALRVFDAALRPLAGHPLATLASQLQGAGHVPFDLRLDPARPAAVVLADADDGPRGGVWWLVWSGTPAAAWLAATSDPQAVELHSLAPDGSWALLLADLRGRTALVALRLTDATAPPLLLAPEVPEDAELVWLRDGVVLVARADEALSFWDLAPFT